MNFHDVQFPPSISFGSAGGPERRTEVVTLASGHEERNSPWAHSRHRYNAGLGARSLDDVHEIISFFEARHGRLYGFRWKDWADYKSGPPNTTLSAGDQLLGTGDGVTSAFQLIKSYSSAYQGYNRIINKSSAGSVLVSVNGASVVEGTDYSVDDTNGVINFTSPPASGALLNVGFTFDVPVRFDTDFLEINLHAFKAGEIPSVPVLEILL